MTRAVRAQSLRVEGLTFDTLAAGRPGASLVLMLHGFPQTNHTWRHQLLPLAKAGYHAVAPNQRGYSQGARPLGVTHYATPLLVEDIKRMAKHLGARRFHLVGHDWGGQLSWLAATQMPDMIASLTVLSRPHPAAFARAMREDSEQAQRSQHHKRFLSSDTVARLLADDAANLRAALANQGVAAEDIDAYLEVLGEPAALEAAVNWYRAAAQGDGLAAADVPKVTVPTLYLWGDADATVGSMAARATAEYVSGPYQFEVLPGVGHFVTDQCEHQLTDLLITHLERNS
jgi:pimeloyl-ACP methyl ester carboxylesterase